MKHRTKICCHCGSETHPQPQDFNHDKGYGHCYTCLQKDNWYIHSLDQMTPDILIDFYDHREINNGPLTDDDSHAKVIEVHIAGKIDYHQTLHTPKNKIKEMLCKKYYNF